MSLADLRLLTCLEHDASAGPDSDAFAAAYSAGCEAAETATSTGTREGWPLLDRPIRPSRIRDSSPREYELFVVEPAVAAAVLTASEAAGWRMVLRGDAWKDDARVREFLRGWSIRGEEILRRQGRSE